MWLVVGMFIGMTLGASGNSSEVTQVPLSPTQEIVAWALLGFMVFLAWFMWRFHVFLADGVPIFSRDRSSRYHN